MTTTLSSPQSHRAPRRHAGTSAAGHMLLALLARIERGSIELVAPDGKVHRFGPGGAPGEGLPAVPGQITLADWHVASASLKGGDVGFAESYLDGHWDSPDLAHLLTVIAWMHARAPGASASRTAAKYVGQYFSPTASTISIDATPS